MTRTMCSLAALIGLFGSATATLAQAEMDSDGDGVLTYEEVLAAYPDMTEETFMTVDTNGDGTLDEDEVAAARDAGMLPAEEG